MGSEGHILHKTLKSFMIKYPMETTKGKASVGSGFRMYSLSWQGRHCDRKKRQLERPQQEATITQSLRL